MNISAVSPGRIGLFLLLTGQMLPAIDTSITNVALDSITQSLRATATQLELIIALYGVTLAVCLAVGSKLGDNYGRRYIMLWGVALFGMASFLCGIAGSVNELLAARVLQGLGAALVVPQILAILHVTLKGTAHARAISLYGGIGGIAFIIGQIGGGWLVSSDMGGLGWRNAFFINVPICLLLLLVSRYYIPETRSEVRSRIDWQGTLLLAALLCCLLFPFALGPELHWPWLLQVMLVATLPLGYLMRKGALSQQQRGLQPLLPPRLLRLDSIRFGLWIALLFFSCWSAFMFCMALTLQSGMGMAPWQSGNSFIALGVAYFLSALLAPKLIARYTLGTILITGISVQMIGLLGLMVTLYYLDTRAGALAIAPASALIGYGQALIVNSFYRVGMRDINANDAGAASAILSTLQQATMGLGPAALGALYLHFHQSNGGNYPQAMVAFLGVEVLLMLILGSIALNRRQALSGVATQLRE